MVGQRLDKSLSLTPKSPVSLVSSLLLRNLGDICHTNGFDLVFGVGQGLDKKSVQPYRLAARLATQNECEYKELKQHCLIRYTHLKKAQKKADPKARDYE